MAGPSRGPEAVSALQWRQFNFFDLDSVKDIEDLGQSPRTLRDLTPPILITPTSPASPLNPSIIVASGNTITILDRHFTPERTFTAWEGSGRATAVVEAGGLLLAVGEEEGSRQPALKVWDLTRDEKKKAGGGPVLVRNAKIQHASGRPHPVSAVALTSNLSHLAVGLGDGTVLLFRHLLQSITASPTALTSLPKARVVVDPNDRNPEAVTGLGFREDPVAGGGSTVASALFIVTTNRVLTAPVSAKGGETRVLDETGAGLGCSVMDGNRSELIVARDDAIYLYSPEGRGACYAYEGQKSFISAFKHNLVIISPPSGSGAARRVARTPGDSGSDIAKITVFDLNSKLIAYTGIFRSGVKVLFNQWDSIFVLEGSGQLSKLEENSTASKLEAMYKRNLYTLALSLAKSQGVADAELAQVHKLYGDYLYGKGDFDGAMDQFIKTLGFLQPSYVIRKFLDAQRIDNLTTYLQELHSRGLANPDHTTLLLNCYTKTSDKARLDTFIKTEARRTHADGSKEVLPFDLDTAIRVCRQASFFEHATYLAKKYGRHEEYLRIQIEDAEEYKDALKYLRSLGPEACEKNLQRYGRSLLQHEPEATTDLLVDLCSGNLGKKVTHAQVHGAGNKAADGSGPAVLSYLGVNRLLGGGQSPATQGDAQSPAGDANGVSTPNGYQTPVAESPAEEDGVSYIPPSPRQFFAHFVDHHDLFVHYLEDVALILWDQKVDSTPPARTGPVPKRDTDAAADPNEALADQRAVWNTLLELYLASTKSEDSTTAAVARAKALSLLASSSTIPYDAMHALVLCSMADFTDGLVGLWESMGMYEDVLRYWMEIDKASPDGNAASNGSTGPAPSDEVLRYLDLYGEGNPSLYPLVLRYLTSSSSLLSRHQDKLPDILETIDAERIMPPLAVVQLLSRNGVASVGTVKDWLRAKIEETGEEIEADKALVESYRTETSSKEKQIGELTSTSQPEVFQVTQCAACNGQLSLPAVHFMCKHSYHQRCLSDSDPECILCSQQHATVREIRRNQTRLADRHDLFIGEVRDSDDGFGVVAGAFGRGLFEKPVVEDE
ncbi:Vacuolar protein sorting-associated protein 11 [Vanrija albida]|uniref:E3 ubiquitin-protein ligase PEP5 n=1 Tax=Vanrija albida TaxID=181172 RepID=A0ABR3QEG4_9TREE